MEVTQEVTDSIEQIVRKRIMDCVWDDPSPPSFVNHVPRPKQDLPEVSTEKSTASLSKLYENDYLEKKESQRPLSTSKITPEIASLWDQVSQALDTLSGFQFASAMDSVHSISSQAQLPSFSTNEIEKGAAIHAASLAVSGASSHTPEEIKRPLRTPLKSELERDSSKTEHQRAKRLRKIKGSKRPHASSSLLNTLSKQKVPIFS